MALNQQDQGTPGNSPARLPRMRAVVQDHYGEADVLRVEDTDRPVVRDHDVLVQVSAASVDRGVWHLMTGLPYPVRLAGYGVRAPKNRVPGMALAGRVQAVGEGVSRVGVGDEVFGFGIGAFAEYARAHEDKIAPKPVNLSPEQAAAVPVSGATALQALRDQARVQPGQRVLVLGASGGVGTFAVQIAKALGAEVTGVCSSSKVDMVRRLGADHVVDYTTTAIGDAGQRYDAVLDIGGNRRLGELRAVLAPSGTLVIVGGETGGRWLGGMDRSLRAVALSPFIGQKLRMFVASETADDLVALTELIESGAVTPEVERTYPLAETAAAIRHMQDGRARGKVVVRI